MSHFPYKISAYFSVFMSALVAGSAMAQTAPAQQPAKPAAPAAAAPAPAGAAPAPAPAAAAPAPTATPPAPVAAPAPTAAAPVATASEVHEHDLYPGLQATITSIKRTPENTVTLRWDLINPTNDAIVMEDMKDSFPDMPDNLYRRVNLIDLTNRKKYTALKDTSNGRYVGRAVKLMPDSHDNLEAVVIPAKGKMSFWLKFAALPKEIQSISVDLGGVEPFSQIPITD